MCARGCTRVCMHACICNRMHAVLPHSTSRCMRACALCMPHRMPHRMPNRMPHRGAGARAAAAADAPPLHPLPLQARALPLPPARARQHQVRGGVSFTLTLTLTLTRTLTSSALAGRPSHGGYPSNPNLTERSACGKGVPLSVAGAKLQNLPANLQVREGGLGLGLGDGQPLS